jgi:hypothetical protein|uniref:ID816 n=1 Tax=Bradyrhizobium japonicum TaxID=375 RepID=Q9AMW2_BRAJP|nr:ID816 [Bradyrhizobium japonicum]
MMAVLLVVLCDLQPWLSLVIKQHHSWRARSELEDLRIVAGSGVHSQAMRFIAICYRNHAIGFATQYGGMNAVGRVRCVS